MGIKRPEHPVALCHYSPQGYFKRKLLIVGVRGALGNHWELVPRSAIQQTPSRLRGMASPLLEEVRHFVLLALISKITNPVRIDWPITWAALTTHNYPMDAGEIESRKRSNQWLTGQETNFATTFSEPVYSAEDSL